MAHKHPVTDSDARFILNPYTRILKDTMPEAKTVMRGDHLSEVITVEMPRTIEGHDMMLCDKRQVWFENGKNKSFDDILDLQVSQEDEVTLVFSWKIPRRATQNVGTLSFMFYFACSGEDDPEYEFHTNPYTKISIKDHPVSKSDVDILQELIDDYIARITFSSIDTVSTAFSKSANIVTESSRLEDGATAISTITFDDTGMPISVAADADLLDITVNYDDDGHPISMTINGAEHPITWNGFEQFEQLNNDDMMLYNGVPLPNIETVWTDEKKKKFAFAAIEDLSDESEFYGEGSPYVLCLYRDRLMKHTETDSLWSGVKVIAGSDSEGYDVYFNYLVARAGLSSDGKTWGTLNETSAEMQSTPVDLLKLDALWYSHDILMPDGSTYLEASPDPVPATSDLTEQQSFMIGYGLGVTGGELPVNLEDGESDG